MALTVTATETANAFRGCMLRVWVLTGQALAQTGASASSAQGSGAAQQQSITTTQAGSVVFGALETNHGTVNFVALPSTTLTDNVADVSNGAQYGTCKTTAATVTPGAVNVGSSTGGQGTIALLEILASAGALAIDASSPAAVTSTAASTVTTASFTPPIGSLLVAAFTGEGSGSGAQTASITDSLGLIWNQQSFLSQSGSGFSGLWTAYINAAALAGTGKLTAVGVSTATSADASAKGTVTGDTAPKATVT